MPESAAEPAVNPYVSPEEDRDNAGRLKPDVAHQVYHDIRQQAKRGDLEIKPGDSPEATERKNQALKQLFDERSNSDLPDYQAAQIVDLEEKAGRDQLTGLLNRREFEAEFTKFLEEEDAKKSKTPMLFLMFDLDYFKNINDSYGHDVGDQALRYLARALTDSVEIGDLVGRWGGEEFVVAVKIKTGEHSDDDTDLLEIAERIRRRAVDLLAKDRYRSDVDEYEISITLSVGATLTKADDTLETVCRRADKNLYKAKNGGRNRSFDDDGQIILAQPLGGRPETVSS